MNTYNLSWREGGEWRDREKKTEEEEVVEKGRNKGEREMSRAVTKCPSSIPPPSHSWTQETGTTMQEIQSSESDAGMKCERISSWRNRASSFPGPL